MTSEASLPDVFSVAKQFANFAFYDSLKQILARKFFRSLVKDFLLECDISRKVKRNAYPEPSAQGDSSGEHRRGHTPLRSREQQFIEVPGGECRKVEDGKLKKPRCGWTKQVLGGNRTTRAALHSTVQKMWFCPEDSWYLRFRGLLM
ncbi:hypothetical protein CEXT_543301 [Caerostris extrusa]|uniref:Uncharacterized protein n=1 Tax=Caerostris extrusa TaxID=172846 RepID=A0AAV4XSX2_CAEEX|nr:hypothetical protein CEXT_543301 [Caerostris extrusa]